TATGFPANGRLVNTSTCLNWNVRMRDVCELYSRQPRGGQHDAHTAACAAVTCTRRTSSRTRPAVFSYRFRLLRAPVGNPERPAPAAGQILARAQARANARS